MNQRIIDTTLVLLMTSSLTFTGLFVWKHTGARAADIRDKSALRHVADWKALATIGHRVGASDVPVTLVAFVDYQCPGCRQFETAVEALVQADSSVVAVEYRHFPLAQIHPLARTAAMAAECAGAVGRFAPMHELLYRDQDSIGVRSWGRFAVRARIADTAGFVRCIRDSTYKAAVDRDVYAAQQLALPGTPSFLVNDSLYMGARSLDELSTLVKAAASHANEQ